MSDTWRRVLGALILIATMGMSTVGALWNVGAADANDADRGEER